MAHVKETKTWEFGDFQTPVESAHSSLLLLTHTLMLKGS